MKLPYRAKRVGIRSLKETAFFIFSAIVSLLIYAVFQWVNQYPWGSQDWRGIVALSGVFGLIFQIPARMAWDSL